MIHFDGKTEEQEEVIKLVFDMIEDLRGKYSKEQIIQETTLVQNKFYRN